MQARKYKEEKQTHSPARGHWAKLNMPIVSEKTVSSYQLVFVSDSEGETAKGKIHYEVRGHIFRPFSVIHEMPSGARVGFFSRAGFGFLLSNPDNHRKTHT